MKETREGQEAGAGLLLFRSSPAPGFSLCCALIYVHHRLKNHESAPFKR
jgi:hypothetical protein